MIFILSIVNTDNKTWLENLKKMLRHKSVKGLSILGGDMFKRSSEFDNHELALNIIDSEVRLDAIIAIHRCGLGEPSFGATRFMYYKDKEDAIDDALRLSRLMSYKAALAGVNYGGAKGVIMAKKTLDEMSEAERRALLKRYAQGVNQLEGRFITGTDMGFCREDIRVMLNYSSYFVGNNIDPTDYTVKGLLIGIEECLRRVFGNSDISGRSFAIQGIGKIGLALLNLIYPLADKIFVADTNRERLETVRAEFPEVKIVSTQEIHLQRVDVFSPCAINYTLNKKTVPNICSRIIAGGANNQIDSRETGELIYRKGIVYAPDYAVNAGGLISVVDEYEHKDRSNERIIKRIGCIKKNINEILEESERQGRPTNLIADEMAEEIFNKLI